MTTTSTPAQRPVVGLLFALAGLVATVSLLFVLARSGMSGVWLGIIADAALAIGFLFLAIGRGSGTIARLFFAIAAVGWIILTIGGLVNIGVLLTIGVVLALIGSLISGILVFTGKIFSRLANVVFLLATIFIALVLLNQLVAYFGGPIALIVVTLYAILLLVSGILIAARR